jgi:hypothetical protein
VRASFDLVSFRLLAFALLSGVPASVSSTVCNIAVRALLYSAH